MIPDGTVAGVVPQSSRRRFVCALALVAGACWLGPRALLGSGDPIKYVVQRGDTLSAIASRYGCSVADLRRLNGIVGDRILAGSTLAVPSRGAVSNIEAIRRANGAIGVARGRWQYIVAHHSAIERGNAAIYDRNHRRRGMVNGLAYHFVIGNGSDSGNGEIEIGTRWAAQHAGGHVRNSNVNEHGIGICLVGNFETRRPSGRQLAALVALIEHLQGEVLRHPTRFAVHREIDGVNHTLCPGRFFPTREMHRRFG